MRSAQKQKNSRSKERCFGNLRMAASRPRPHAPGSGKEDAGNGGATRGGDAPRGRKRTKRPHNPSRTGNGGVSRRERRRPRGRQYPAPRPTPPPETGAPPTPPPETKTLPPGRQHAVRPCSPPRRRKQRRPAAVVRRGVADGAESVVRLTVRATSSRRASVPSSRRAAPDPSA